MGSIQVNGCALSFFPIYTNSPPSDGQDLGTPLPWTGVMWPSLPRASGRSGSAPGGLCRGKVDLDAVYWELKEAPLANT